jgi:UDPglucose 6-dehydrogenase
LYHLLEQALQQVFADCQEETQPKIVVVVSTVLPGTTRELLRYQDVPPNVRLLYNPSFCAMGTTVHDFLVPEFVLIGLLDQSEASWDAVRVLTALYDAVLVSETAMVYHTVSVESAELSKVIYNTYISAKLAIIGVVSQLCHRTPNANVDAVAEVLRSAHRRVAGAGYFHAGVGDGGACHPRDNIAMSWLAKNCQLRHDLFREIMLSREAHARFLIDILQEAIHTAPKPDMGGRRKRVMLLGYAYKADSNLTAGSVALLIKRLLPKRLYEVALFDPLVDQRDEQSWQSYVTSFKPDAVLIGCDHEVQRSWWMPDCPIIDPFRTRSAAPNVVSVGVGPRLAL